MRAHGCCHVPARVHARVGVQVQTVLALVLRGASYVICSKCDVGEGLWQWLRQACNVQTECKTRGSEEAAHVLGGGSQRHCHVPF